MQHAICYTHTERFWLAALGAFGFFVVNGAFVYGLLFQPDAMTAAWTNPLAAAFIVEALVLVGVFAYLFERWEVSRLGWGWFVFLSLLGSMAFAIPVVLLFPKREGSKQPSRKVPHQGQAIRRESDPPQAPWAK